MGTIRRVVILCGLSLLTTLTASTASTAVASIAAMGAVNNPARAHASRSSGSFPGSFGALAAEGTVGALVTPDAPGTPDVSGSSGASPIQTYEPVVVPTVIVKEGVYRPAGEGNFPYADRAFELLWSSADGPLAHIPAGGGVPKPWAWGPGPNTRGLLEPYREDPTGLGQRLVQYFDKSRMELNDPLGDPADPFYVSNGLLTVELVSGLVQQGHDTFVPFRPACIPLVGDQVDKLAPTYAAMGALANTRLGDHPSPDRTRVRVIETVDRSGNVGSDARLGDYEGVDIVHYEFSTRHNIPRIFWDFLNSARIPTDQGAPSSPANPTNATRAAARVLSPRSERAPIAPTALPQPPLPWYFASGLPISEPYWTRATIAGKAKDVMVQLFERRALTYVPENTPEWRVEMANIGQHYFDWRYRNLGVCRGQEGAVGTPTPPRLAPTPLPLPLPLPPPTPTDVGDGGPRAIVDVVAYVDMNDNDSADPGEGLRGLRVVLIHRQTNSPQRRVQTDRNGHAHLEWRWLGAMNISLPDIGWIDTVEAGEVESKSMFGGIYRGQSGAWTSEDDGSLLLKVRVKPIALPAVIP